MTSDPGPVFRLMYRSHLVVAPPRRAAEIAAIFEVARRRNLELAVTGALLIWQDYVVQTLEGREDVVRDLYAEIADDPRHEDVTLVEARTAATRTFAKWSMARVAETDDRDAEGPRPADEDEIRCGPDGHSDTDRLITTMRGHAAP